MQKQVNATNIVQENNLLARMVNKITHLNTKTEDKLEIQQSYDTEITP